MGQWRHFLSVSMVYSILAASYFFVYFFLYFSFFYYCFLLFFFFFFLFFFFFFGRGGRGGEGGEGREEGRRRTIERAVGFWLVMVMKLTIYLYGTDVVVT
jgi:hypothetical protein